MDNKLIIFDMDGTILYTLKDLCDALNFALSENGFPVRTIDEVRYFVGNGNQKLIERGLPANSSDEIKKIVFESFTKYYKEHCYDSTKPYDGIISLLMALKLKGFKIAVVSNKDDYAVQILCDKFFKGLFDYSVGSRPEFAKKPAPDAVDFIINNAGFDKNNSIYVGDSNVDLETAKNAQIKCISVDWGFRTHDELVSYGAEFIAGRPIEVFEIVNNL